jgi:hypothetical protein
MSFIENLHAKNAKATTFGLPSAPVAIATTPAVSSKTVQTTLPAIKAEKHALVSTTCLPMSLAPVEWFEVFQPVLTGFEKGDTLTSADARVTLSIRNTSYECGGAYGAVSVVSIDGIARTKFSHYPVHFLAETNLTSVIHKSAEGCDIPVVAGLNIKSVRLQLEGKLIKVLQDSNGNLRFVSKTKAEVGPAHRALLMTTLANSYMERTGETDFTVAAYKVFCSVMAMTAGGAVATFRLIHPDVTYVRGPYDLSKNSPVAVCVSIEQADGVEIWMTRGALAPENRDVIVVPCDIYDACNLDSFGAVMVGVYNAETGIVHNAKLVSEECRERHQAVEGINGNFSAHLVRVGLEKAPAIRLALDPVHWPAFDEAVLKATTRTTDGLAIVARFLERNFRALKTDGSDLVKALCKMDSKLAQRLVGGAKLFDPKRSATAFVRGMKPEMLDSHVRLLTEVVEKKLAHTNPDVSASARLVKTLM